jgi:hypothetical protein
MKRMANVSINLAIIFLCSSVCPGWVPPGCCGPKGNDRRGNRVTTATTHVWLEGCGGVWRGAGADASPLHPSVEWTLAVNDQQSLQGLWDWSLTPNPKPRGPNPPIPKDMLTPPMLKPPLYVSWPKNPCVGSGASSLCPWGLGGTLVLIRYGKRERRGNIERDEWENKKKGRKLVYIKVGG